MGHTFVYITKCKTKKRNYLKLCFLTTSLLCANGLWADLEREEQRLKRDAGSQKKAKALVMAESKPTDDILLEYMESFMSPGASKKAAKIADFSRKSEKMSVVKA